MPSRAESENSFAASARGWKVCVYFRATNAEAYGLREALEPALAELFLDRFDGPEHARPRFEYSVMRPLTGSRRFALRWALVDLWRALRRGEVP